ncbi:hypothetical protein HPP92_017112 [Vanilla planifolia]|uniref:HMA domain-containing protein n=1 Tax=Vanilla planifolia TaxID=51239 RepID=A0A835QMG2_VANPL|nr:hypothetical protein HPP92_017112 [Vanilla planifolia]
MSKVRDLLQWRIFSCGCFRCSHIGSATPKTNIQQNGKKTKESKYLSTSPWVNKLSFFKLTRHQPALESGDATGLFTPFTPPSSDSSCFTAWRSLNRAFHFCPIASCYYRVKWNMGTEKRIQKSYFDVLGLCCSSEVPLIEKILKPLDGIKKVTVIVPSKTVIVVHDNLQISQMQIVGGAIALSDYSEAGFIVFLFTMAEWLESLASHKATIGMSSLMCMAPQKAILAETGLALDTKDIEVGTVIAIKAGEVIPIDGIVVEGRSEVDEKSLTGESFPVAKEPQSLVFAGTLNMDGYISVKTTALADDSAISKMARLVEEAQNSRSRTQRLIDSCAKYYTPAVVVIAAGVAVGPAIFGVSNEKHWFQLALVLLVGSCPCALVLSTPVVTFCALLKAARIGLFVKGGDVFEALAKTKIVAFDKTGTITQGEFSVTEFRSLSCQVSTDMLLSWMSSIERKSSHPMASALIEHARSNAIEPKPEQVVDFNIYPGEGVSGEINGNKIYIGNKKIAMRAGCLKALNLDDINDGVTIVYVFLGAEPIGAFALSDTCRTGAREGIKELKSLGIKTVILTGDNTAAAMHAQKQLENVIEEIHAELLPEDKVRLISDLKRKYGSITMVGDGMNDAPALAMADVGISMGISGSAVAVETSHITLLSNDIRKIPKAIRLAKRARLKIVMNIIFSIVTKIAIVGLAIGGHPLVWAAVLADVGTCLIVILNSMTLAPTRERKENKCCRRAVPAMQRSACNKICTKDSCASPRSSGKAKSKSCHSNHGCCKNEKKEEDMPHGCCKRACEERELRSESPAHCSAGQVNLRGNASCKNEKKEENTPHCCCSSACEERELRSESPAQRCSELPECRKKDSCEYLIAKPCEEHPSGQLDHDQCCHGSFHREENSTSSRQPISCNLKLNAENDSYEYLIAKPCEESPSGQLDHDQCCHGSFHRERNSKSSRQPMSCNLKLNAENDSYEHLIAKPCEEHPSGQLDHDQCCHGSFHRERNSTSSKQPISCNLKLNAERHYFSACGDQTLESDTLKASDACRGLEKKGSGNCCEFERQCCQRKRECSNLLACNNKMKIESCCRSYMEDCLRPGVCCGNGMMQVPEIIIE